MQGDMKYHVKRNNSGSVPCTAIKLLPAKLQPMCEVSRKFGVIAYEQKSLNIFWQLIQFYDLP